MPCISLDVKFSKSLMQKYKDGQAYSPSYSGRDDQEDRGLKPAQANSSRDPILKKTHHKKGLMQWLTVWTLSSNPSTTKKIQR
jgi:hypothetical protein